MLQTRKHVSRGRASHGKSARVSCSSATTAPADPDPRLTAENSRLTMERVLKALDAVDGIIHAARLVWTGHHRRTLRRGMVLALLLLVAIVLPSPF